MKHAFAAALGIAVFGWGTAGRSDTALVAVTPRNMGGGTFSLTSRERPRNQVEFVIRRDVRKVDGPGRRGYLSHPPTDGKSIGTPVKLEEAGGFLEFRFSLPADRVAESVFTLWGRGLEGEGVTYRFRLGDFRKPDKN